MTNPTGQDLLGEVDAEFIVLGSMLRDPVVVADVVQVLRPENFHKDVHCRIFAAMLRLFDGGKAISPATVGEDLLATGQLRDVRPEYLHRLWEDVGTGASGLYYAAKVRDAAILRDLARAGHEITSMAESPSGSAEEALEAAEQRVFAIAEMGFQGDAVPLATAVGESFDRIDARSQRGKVVPSGLMSGFADLDNLTAGLQDGELTVVAARPGVGKTAFGLAIVRHAALLLGQPVFMVSLEMSRVELAERLLCGEAGVNGHRLRRGVPTDSEADRLWQAGDALRKANVMIADAANQTMLRITANARRIKLRSGLKLVVVDYLQLIEPEMRKENRQAAVADISRRLKKLARELGVPVVALAQLNRGVEDRSGGVPRLSDLRESGAIEADSDVVILLHRPDMADETKSRDTIRAHVAKQRNGPMGTVNLVFDRETMRFDNFAPAV